MQIVRTAILALIFLAQAHASAFAEKRVALVIGNSAYQNVAPLGNPVRDAAAIATMFKNAKFDVVVSRNDLSALEMRRALRDFADKSRDADMAVIYYAGHGLEVEGTNYLVPVDARLERDTDVYDEAFALDRLLIAVEPAKQLRLVILDACRDNPFSRMLKQANSTRSIGRGLAKVEPASPNTMVAFAAKAGSTAQDGDGKNSPFAIALVNHLTTPGLDLRKAFGFVRDDVLKATNNKQEPFVYGSLGGNDVALVPLPAPPVAAAPASSNSARTEARVDYELAERVGTKAAWDVFINDYPAGFYTDLAKVQRDKAMAEEARVAATQKAKATADEKARLAAEGAQAAEQAKAAAAARAAEEARIAAEKKKAIEDEKVAAAERAKAAALAKSTDKTADSTKLAADTRTADDKPTGPVASLSPAEQAPQGDNKSNAPATSDVPKLLQVELRRVGCNTGSVDGSWGADSQKSLGRFNKSAGTKLDVKVASIDALDVVKSKQGRICPLVCEDGFKADGDRCVRITCRAGYELGDDNTCERIEPKKKRATREAEPIERPRRAAPEALAPARPPALARPLASARPQQPSGQIICTDSGCRPVARGCHLEIAGYDRSNGMSGQNEVCR
jgi:uncharacterized caspase-like protein